jgi:CRP-like cAMP-binding protein
MRRRLAVCGSSVPDGLQGQAPRPESRILQDDISEFGSQRMQMMERVTVLRSLDIFRTLPDADLTKVASLVKGKELQAGEDIIREGELGTSMFIIVEGRVRVHSQGTQIAILGSGSVVGELAALDPEVRMASVTALNQMFLLELDGDALSELLAERIDVARGLLQALCRRVRSTLPK